MRRSRRAALLVVVVAAALLAGGLPAAAVPPPPDPGDAALARSRDAVAARAAEVGTLAGRLADLDARADDVAADLAARREDAEAASVDLTAARAAAAEAVRAADEAAAATDAAGSAVDDARARLDVFVAATYQEGLDTGPFGLLAGAQDPADLVARAEFTEMVAQSELAARDRLERARVARANTESRARAARADAQAREGAAEVARRAADTALAAADAAARDNARQLAELAAERAAVQERLEAAEARDAGLRARRDRFRGWQRQMAAEQAARERAAREQATARLAGGGGRVPPVLGGPGPGGSRGPVRRVIDRALSQVGVQYVWGGGNGRGPSTGIPDAFGSPLDRIGFDCSGLMLYAYNGAGVSLPRVSRNQFHAGRKVPVSDLRPGDMVFYQRRGAPIHHVAMYIGGGDMVEAPYTGANVRVVPLRRTGLVPHATRLL